MEKILLWMMDLTKKLLNTLNNYINYPNKTIDFYI